MKKCPNCNYQTQDNAEAFCSKCGAKLETIPEKRYCISCGAELKPNANFCAHCGTKAEPAEEDASSSCKQAAQMQEETQTTGTAEQQYIGDDLLKLGLEEYDKGQYDSAVNLVREAADMGNPYALITLACFYGNGTGVEKDEQKALEWAHKAEEILIEIAEHGDVAAQLYLAAQYRDGNNGFELNKDKAFEWFQRAAEQGDAQAQYEVGMCYELGTGVKQNYNEAAEWYHKAAEQGNTYAQMQLGGLYNNGLGVKEDKTESLRWYHKAEETLIETAERGDVEMQFYLAILFYGCFVKNDALSNKWLCCAAEQGHDKAQFCLAYRYDKGLNGLEKNEQLAQKWYRKLVEQKRIAAERGDVAAQYLLARCYDEGHGVEENTSEALKWYRKAAEQGHVKAEKRLKYGKKISNVMEFFSDMKEYF